MAHPIRHSFLIPALQTVFILLFFFVGVGIAISNPRPGRTSFSAFLNVEGTDPQVVPGIVVVKLKAGFSESSLSLPGPRGLASAMKTHGVFSVQKAFSSEIRSLAHADDLGRIFLVQYSGPENPQSVALDLAQDPGIEWAEPKYIHWVNAVPNDPVYNLMENLKSVHAAEAWDIVKGEQGDVVIAVVDGGTEWTHPDLAVNIWNNVGEIPGNGIDDDANGFADDIRGWNFADNSNNPAGLPQTPNSAAHGTHVSGTACGVTNNNHQIAGMSWNCKVMPVNVSYPASDNAMAYGFEGIVYAVQNGASVINCSWGRTGSASSFEQDVLEFAHANDVLVVAAAGNDATNNDLSSHYPASYDRVLAVGAIENNDVKAGFSTYGVSIEVFAPGVSIYSTLPNSGYGNSFSGTSMASPLVAGLAGLVRTAHADWTADQVHEQIRVSCDPIDGINPNFTGLLGRGRVNAFQALTMTGVPSVRVAAAGFADTETDSVVLPGDRVDIDVSLINYLDPASPVTVYFASLDTRISVVTPAVILPSIANDEIVDVVFRFNVLETIEDGTALRFRANITASGQTDRDIFLVPVNPVQVKLHDTGLVRMSITAEGNLGFNEFYGSAGQGFVYNGENWLYEAGLLVGTGPSTVSDCIRGADGFTQEKEFRKAWGESLTLVSPGTVSGQEGRIRMNDSTAASPLGIEVLQNSYSFSGDGIDGFVIVKYTILNRSASTLSNLWTGLFFDWDMDQGMSNDALWDDVRKMGYTRNAGAPTKLGGVRLLTLAPGVSYRAIHNPNEIYGGFPTGKKWQYLSSGIQTTSVSGVDVSMMIGAGPFSIGLGGIVEAVFAVVGGSSLSELQVHADSALAVWNRLLSGATASVGGLVWVDEDRNGVREQGESGKSGISVALFSDDGDGVAEPGSDDGSAVQTQVTDVTGAYRFFGIVPDRYFVRFVLSQGWSFSPADAGLDDGVDSDADMLSGTTPVFDVAESEVVSDLDAGVFRIQGVGGTIEGRVWLDADGNGIQDAPETGLSGVTVECHRDVDADGSAEPGGDDGSPVTIGSTDGLGQYRFDTLDPDSYFLTFGLLPGHRFSPVHAGVDSLDSDVDPFTGLTDVFPISDEDSVMVRDAGMTPVSGTTGNIGDRVWRDSDGDGVQDPAEGGIAGVIMILLYDIHIVVAVDTTDANGHYDFIDVQPGSYTVHVFTSSVPPSYRLTTGNEPMVVTLSAGQDFNDADFGYSGSVFILGDRVWLDADADGVQDSGESGLAGVYIHLYADADGDGTAEKNGQDGSAIISTTTDPSGNYRFEGVNPGAYFIEFGLLSGYVFSPKNMGIETTDSDVDPAIGLTDVFLLSVGDVQDWWDAGMHPPPMTNAAVGGRVWNDRNADSIQDADEVGITGVRILLKQDGSLIAECFTESGSGGVIPPEIMGVYRFDDVVPGEYTVEVDGTTLPEEYVLTTGNMPFPLTLSSGQNVLDVDFGYRHFQTDVDRMVENQETGQLLQNYPNPFNASTMIPYYLPTASEVLISIFDTQGRLVKVLIHSRQDAGFHSMVWDGTDCYGRAVPAGVYSCSMTWAGRRMIHKICLVK